MKLDSFGKYKSSVHSKKLSRLKWYTDIVLDNDKIKELCHIFSRMLNYVFLEVNIKGQMNKNLRKFNVQLKDSLVYVGLFDWFFF